VFNTCIYLITLQYIARGVTLTTHPHLVPRSWMWSYTSSPPPTRLHRCVVRLLYLLLYWTTVNEFIPRL
jgi:hypothetical protein